MAEGDLRQAFRVVPMGSFFVGRLHRFLSLVFSGLGALLAEEVRGDDACDDAADRADCGPGLERVVDSAPYVDDQEHGSCQADDQSSDDRRLPRLLLHNSPLTTPAGLLRNSRGTKCQSENASSTAQRMLSLSTHAN